MIITRIQIETIDDCNAACVMCPSKSLPHTGQNIGSELFSTILDKILEGIRIKLVSPDPEIYLYLSNEPLLDPQLISRINLVKEKIPRSRIIIFTNGVLLKKFEEDLARSKVDLIYLSLYGYDAGSFNKVTGLSITGDDFSGMIGSANNLKSRKEVIIANSWYEENGKKVLKKYSSRAGFYSKKILHEKIYGCKHERNEGWLNITCKGDILLCCMDWRQEAILGNIRDTSLLQLVTSETAQLLFLKSKGLVDSEPDFICKRCEWAETSLPVRVEKNALQEHKTLIITAATEDRSSYLIDFIVSLRTRGKYSGELLVLDFGLSPDTVKFVKGYNVQVESFTGQFSGYIVNTRLLAVQKLIESKKINHPLLVLYDVDVWFNGDINPLFARISSMQGCLFSAEYRPGFYTFGQGRGPGDAVSEERNLKKMTRVVTEFGGHLNAGLMAGKYEPFCKKIDSLCRMMKDGYKPETWGSDQYLYNLLFEFGVDVVDGKVWNCVLNDLYIANGRYIVKDWDQPEIYPSREAIGIHCYGVFSPEKQTPFRFGAANAKILRENLYSRFRSEFLLKG